MQLHLHYRAIAELERSSRSATNESKEGTNDKLLRFTTQEPHGVDINSKTN